MPNGISHSQQLDHSISNLRVVGWYFQFFYSNLNPLKPNGISLRYQLEKFISVLRVVGWHFLVMFKF